jgi:hypothetical protein
VDSADTKLYLERLATLQLADFEIILVSIFQFFDKLIENQNAILLKNRSSVSPLKSQN